jgi:hypothetical protein
MECFFGAFETVTVRMRTFQSIHSNTDGIGRLRPCRKYRSFFVEYTLQHV